MKLSKPSITHQSAHAGRSEKPIRARGRVLLVLASLGVAAFGSALAHGAPTQEPSCGVEINCPVCGNGVIETDLGIEVVTGEQSTVFEECDPPDVFCDAMCHNVGVVANWESLPVPSDVVGPYQLVVDEASAAIYGQALDPTYSFSEMLKLENGTWTRLPQVADPKTFAVSSIALDGAGILYAAGAWNVGWYGPARFMRLQGGEWTDLPSLPEPLRQFEAAGPLIFDEASGKFYATVFNLNVTPIRSEVLVFADESWTLLGSPGFTIVQALKVDAAGNVYAGGYDFPMPSPMVGRVSVRSATGQWTSIDPPGAEAVYALALDPQGGLIATMRGGPEVGGIVSRFANGSWTSMGFPAFEDTFKGHTDEITALALDPLGRVYAGGFAGGLPRVVVLSRGVWTVIDPWPTRLGGQYITDMVVDSLGRVHVSGVDTTPYPAEGRLSRLEQLVLPHEPPDIHILEVVAASDGCLPSMSVTTFPATVGAGPVSVTGAVEKPGVTSVIVNGIVVQANGSWTASDVPLKGATNTIVATAPDAVGSSVSVSLGPDLDGDGLANNIDWEPNSPSSRFADTCRGGTTSGEVVSSLAGALEILDAPFPDGVRIRHRGGQACFKLDCSAARTCFEGEIVVTCNTVTLSVLEGKAEVSYVLNGVPVLVVAETGSTVLLRETTDAGGLTNLTVNAVVGAAKVNGVPVSQAQSLALPAPVGVDIKPGSFPNSISLKKSGTIPVALLSTSAFDATIRVDRSSLTFGRVGNEPSLWWASVGRPGCSDKDVNGDRLTDLICHFDTSKTSFRAGDTEGVLRGRRVDTLPIEGRDSVRIVQ